MKKKKKKASLFMVKSRLQPQKPSIELLEVFEKKSARRGIAFVGVQMLLALPGWGYVVFSSSV